MIKKVMNHAVVLCSAAWGGLVICFILKYLTTQFLEALFSSQFNRLGLQRLYMLTIERTAFALLLIAFGAFFSILYYVSSEAEQFLKYAAFFFFAAPFVVTIWDYEIIFFAGREMAVFWSKSGDISLIFMILVFHLIVINHLRIENGKALQWIECVAACASTIAIIPLRTIQTAYVLKFYLACETILFAVILYRYIRRICRTKTVLRYPKITLIMTSVPGISQIAVLYLVAFYKFDTFSEAYGLYRNYMQIIIMGISVITFFYFFWYYRLQIFYGKEAGKKIQEITTHKERITQLIIHFCEYPINRLSFFFSVLQPKNGKTISSEMQTELLGEMQREVSRLKQHLRNINDFCYLQGDVIHADKIKVNLLAVFTNATKKLEQDGTSKKNIQISAEDLNIDVCGEPYSLIQASQTLLDSFCGIAKQNPVWIVCKTRENYAQISIATQIPESNRRDARRIYKIFRDANYIRFLDSDEDIVLAAAKNYLLNHDPNMSADIIREPRVRKLVISFRLNLWQEDLELYPLAEEAGTRNEAKQKEILLLSNAPDQIELIKTYLMTEPYHFQFFSVVEDMLAYMEQQRDIGVLIIGTVLFEKDIESICTEVRKRYSFEQLPILFVYPEHFTGIESYLNQSINDILAEPFAQPKLLRKIKLLLTLQKSADETLKSRLNFLQAQMDPHFIFNTLSTIMPLCIQNPQKAYEVLNDFSDYLRGRLYAGEMQEPVLLSRETDLIEAYLSIEKVRFTNTIQYQINNAYASSILMLPLLMEPIVENCVKHGVRENHVLHISIDLVEDDDYLYCSIKDDGKGMLPEQLLDVKQGTTSAKRSIGIDNVRKRLLLYYHEKLYISSTLDKGTTVSFKIPVHSPFLKGENYHESENQNRFN